MPNQIMHPALSQLLPLDKIPNELEALRDALISLFEDLFVKDLIVGQRPDGSAGFYSMKLTTYNSLGINVPMAEDLKLVLNPTDTGATEIPVSFSYSWLIMRYISNFDYTTFDNTARSILYILFDLAEINQKKFLSELLVTFYPGPTSLEDFAAEFNVAYPGTITMPTDPNLSFDAITQNISRQISKSDSDLLSFAYSSKIDIEGEAMDRLKKLFSRYFDNIEENLSRALKLSFNATINQISAGLQFPRKWLVPVYTGIEPVSGLNENDPLPESYYSYLKFNVGSLEYSSDKGFAFNNAGDFSLSRSMIGKTGIILEFEGLKVDLSRDKNIPEADQDGRTSNFLGAYAEYAAVTLPEKWFKKEDGQTLKIAGRNLLVGTGGISGTILLETENNTPSQIDDTFWFKLGNSFRLGFNRFDITFNLSKVVSSNITGVLEIKKFKYPEGHPKGDATVQIIVVGHLGETGDFNLTATVQDYPIRLPEVFTYTLKTVELGREGDGDFYLGTSGMLQFDGILKDVLNIGSIEIQALRIYSDGKIEFSGGSINLIEPIVLPIGPADITVTAIHYGSHQKEVNGVMRKFNFFGFDGGLNVDPLGIEIRGDGIKYYYCTEDSTLNYLHIQTIELDLTIPANAPVAIIRGWLSIPDPGVSPEYSGGITLQLPEAKISGSADMKLAPRYPAFIIDAEIEFPAPIPLGTFAIYGFRGLLGYRYVASKEAAGLVSGVDTWYDYYKKPPRGIQVQKFAGPNQTTNASDPFSIGAGASLGTSFDDGTIMNLKAMVLLSIPSLFMIDGRAAVLSARLGLEDTKDPPFFAFAAIGDNSIEMGFGADFKMPTSSGSILKLYAEVQAAFFFDNPSKWYINVGTKANPNTAKILELVSIKSYLMLSAKGIEAGARGDFDFERNYAGIIKVHAWAYIEIGGKISFERPQFGAYLDAGVGAEIKVKFVHLSASFQILFAVEAAEPFLIYGKVRIKIKIKILWVFKFSFNAEVEVLWEVSKKVDRTPINPFINADKQQAIPELVKGVNMLNNEVFELAYLGSGIPTGLPTGGLPIIPLDTYIDIKTEKALLPSESVSLLIGGYTNPASNYVDLVPPDKVVKGKELRQVRHEYSFESITLRYWNPSTGIWEEYNPYEALYPDDPSLGTLKIGQFQKMDMKYNTVRLLATTPFSYTEQGQPGWFIPEQYGLTPGAIFCEAEKLVPVRADFLKKPRGQKYLCDDANQMFYSNNVAFLLLKNKDEDFAYVSNYINNFNFAQSLAFDTRNKLQVVLPQPSVYASLKLTSDSQGVRVKYYAALRSDSSLEVQYGNPDPLALNQTVPYTKIVSVKNLNKAIIYDKPDWRPITKIVIEPIIRSSFLASTLHAQIGSIHNFNLQVGLGLAQGPVKSSIALQNKLDYINNFKGAIVSKKYTFKLASNQYKIFDEGEDKWKQSWDIATDHKVEGNVIGFKLSGNTLKVESDFQITDIRLMPDYAIRQAIDNRGFDLDLVSDNINSFISNGTLQVEVDLYENCKEDYRLCSLSRRLNTIKSVHLIDTQTLRQDQVATAKAGMQSIRSLVTDFDRKNEEYKLSVKYAEPINAIDNFINREDVKDYPAAYNAVAILIPDLQSDSGCDCDNDECIKITPLCLLYERLIIPLNGSIKNPRDASNEDLPGIASSLRQVILLLESYNTSNPELDLLVKYKQQTDKINLFLSNPTMINYPQAYEAMQYITSKVKIDGNCDCGHSMDDLEDLYNAISDIFNDHFVNIGLIKDFLDLIKYINNLLDLINDFNEQYPGYDIIIKLGEYIKGLQSFINNPNYGTLEGAIKAIQYIRNFLSQIGHFAIGKLSKTTLLHQVCWLSLEAYHYNQNIPGQEAIAEDAQATIDGITKYIQPVWKPNTSYLVNFVLKDTVDDGTEVHPPFEYTYGFTTAGPVGYFHTAIPPRPDSYALSSLTQYIDYERSYPNADGNLLSAKPLFYNDLETSQIFLYFIKAYATHFFNNWTGYNGNGNRAGRLKVVIKDPVEGDEIVNPPYLDYDEDDITTINIPQTIEEWKNDMNPLMPFVLRQWRNLYNSNNCIIIGAEPIKPASKFISIQLKHLKPSKLYTAIVNNLYDVSGNDEFTGPDKAREVHRFVFQTSRYASFKEQVNSYLLKDGEGADLITKKAIFTVSKEFTLQQINLAYNSITQASIVGDDKYQHVFDRVFEGILGFSPINTPISTEFNIIRNKANNNKVIAIIIKNPEPFNIPKIPLNEMNDAITVYINGIPNDQYKVLHSKDYSQAIIMHASKQITASVLNIGFKFKMWDGFAYSQSGGEEIVSIEL